MKDLATEGKEEGKRVVADNASPQEGLDVFKIGSQPAERGLWAGMDHDLMRGSSSDDVVVALMTWHVFVA
eukprot:SAG31_NODE_28383_length_411_cov_0.570513_1_plen_70_part_00